MIGQTISHYQILEKLGEGGMGVVYKAHDEKLHRDVALKFLPPYLTSDSTERERFLHEARAAAILNHPNIATVHEIDEHDGRLFLAMELIEGGTLRNLLGKEPMSVEKVLDVGIQVSEGLSAAHDKGIIHRDIKPENIMVTGKGHAKIMDFGLAKTVGVSTLTKTGATLGTVLYMSPEQARGEKVDHRSDIWSFGAVLYEMVTGQMPFKSQYNDAMVYMILNENPQPVTALRTGVPMELERIIAKCLQKKPSDRYQHMDDVIVDLRKVSVDSVKTTSPPSRIWRSPSRKWIAIALTAAAIASVIILYVSVPNPTDGEIHSIAVLPLWQNSIAVLPFKNVSSDTEQEYFCDGMTEQLITNLTNLPNVKVIARTSVMQFKNSDKTIPQIAQELGVAHVLEGSVRKSGNRIRVTAQLIKADDGFHLWARDYDRQVEDIFAMQDDVSSAIVQALKVNIPLFRQHSTVTTAPKNIEAYDLYLRGNFFLHKSDEESLNRALDYFQKSIEKDRSYAPPYAGVAYAHATLADAYLPPKDAYPKAKSAALKALELDSTIAEARAALAFILGAYERDQLSSQREFRRAKEFNPNSVDVLWLSALYLSNRTGSAEAIALADRAIALDPLNPFASWTKEYALYYAHQYDEVIEQHERTVKLDPNFFYADSPVSRAYLEKGMLKEALDEYMKIQKIMPEQPLYGLAALYARMGNQRKARSILRDLINESTKRYIAPSGPAMVYISLGEKDLAFEWLDRAYEAHDTFLHALKTDARYEPIHSDPRYAMLLKKMGFEK